MNKQVRILWPLPEMRPGAVPGKNHPGTFWACREDRHHGGVDLYAPPGTPVVSTEKGRVLETGRFTDPNQRPYWNTTYFVLIYHESGLTARYAELMDFCVKTGETVRAGQLLGHVGAVLNLERIDGNAPAYIRKLGDEGRSSMLHFELYTSPHRSGRDYSGGNWFRKTRPAGLLDPVPYLISGIVPSSISSPEESSS
ncbi:MAG TPA: M23 family metallopeptidase [bacterium]|nr:M23 family metallopeptidase [bacterium]